MAKKALITGALILAIVAVSGAAFAAADPAPKTVSAANCGVGVGQMLGGQYLMKEVEKATGLSVAEVRTARLSGKSFAQMLTEKGKDIKAFVATLVAGRKAAVEQLVASGKITKDQAEITLKNFQANVEQNLSRTTTGPNGNGAGCRGQGQALGRGQGGRMGGRWNNAPSSPAPR